MPKLRVIVAMSGGVDSSVAAALLKEEGYELSGVTMKIWSGETPDKEGLPDACYGPGEGKDIDDAKKVAEILGIPLQILDLRQEYKSSVLNYFCDEYLSGRTPNPCIICNRMIKFGAMLKKIKDRFDYFATGHYARVEQNKGRYLLKKAKDPKKDQSYFLYSLSQEQLGFSLFPLGNYTKAEVRQMAEKFGLGIENRQESQNFIAGGYFSLFKEKPGPILNRQEKIIGEHRGIPFYTVGQRKGIRISSGERLYVTSIDQQKNALVVGAREDLFGGELIASNLNWVAIKELKEPIRLKAKIRYLHKEDDVEITPLGREKIHLKFRRPQMAITPGQAVVFYDDDIVVGGGTIDRVESRE